MLRERCAGIDVHKDQVTVAVRTPGPGAGRAGDLGQAQVRRVYGVLREMTRWLVSQGVTHVAMEATGIYSMPVYHALLEHGDFERVLVCNAGHVKNVPGRKTDLADAEWLAQLLECGLLAGSFIPPAEVKAVRDVIRYRRKIVQERASETQRLGGVLQDAGIKLDSVASSIDTVSGLAMIRALIDGERRGEVLADLARGRMRSKIGDLSQALEGRFGDHHALMCQLHLDHVAQLNEMIARLDAQVESMMVPFAAQRRLLVTIPGIGQVAAAAIISEIGITPVKVLRHRRAPGLAGRPVPGNHESAGRRKHGKPCKGMAKHLQPLLVECAWSAGPHQRPPPGPVPPAGAALRRLPQPRRQKTRHRRHRPHPGRDHLARPGQPGRPTPTWDPTSTPPAATPHGETQPPHRQTGSPRPHRHPRTRRVNTTRPPAVAPLTRGSLRTSGIRSAYMSGCMIANPSSDSR